jgi:GNAT superfamily N-acetyltransferase
VLKEDISDALLPKLQSLLIQVFDLSSAWAQHLEGSYVPEAALRHLPPPTRKFLYLNHGSRELVRSDHDDSLVVYWVLREKGVALAGPEPRAFVSPVSEETHTAFAAEVYVMGVKRPWHRREIGRALIETAVELATSNGVRFLTVKTLSPSNDDPNYARTRLFYEAVGFMPIEEFPSLWGLENPCIFMFRPIRSG